MKFLTVPQAVFYRKSISETCEFEYQANDINSCILHLSRPIKKTLYSAKFRELHYEDASAGENLSNNKVMKMSSHQLGKLMNRIKLCVKIHVTFDVTGLSEVRRKKSKAVTSDWRVVLK